MKLEKYLDYLVSFIQQTVTQAHADGVIVGISGGVDSAVVASLAKKAFPKNHLVVWMPINSSKLDWDCTQELINKKELNAVTLDLLPTFELWQKQTKLTAIELSPLALANTKARLRMTSLYALGQTKNYLVLGTDNFDEWYIGYFTKHGDGGADLVPIIHLLKTEVFAAAKILEIPESIIKRPPTASLWEGQTDEKEIGFSYEEMDNFFLGRNQNKNLKNHLEKLHQASEHKRNLPITPQPFIRK